MQLNLGKVRGDDGANVYVKYNTSASDTGAADFWSQGQKYIGLLSSASKTKPTTGYTWIKFVGDDGIPGTPGKNGSAGINGTNGANGTDGRNCYVKYSVTDSITGATDNWTAGQTWIGFALSNVATAPTGNAEYRWCKFAWGDTDLLNLVYPVGSVYESTNNASPASFIGGTWEAYGGGRVLVGKGTSDKVYGINSSGGQSNVTLSESHLPVITPKYNCGWYDESQKTPTFNSDVIVNKRVGYGDQSGVINSFGGGQPHENMPPYIVVYRWRRTA